MAKENGGVIGIVNTPTSTTASGVWALQDQYEAKRNSNWPLTPFVSQYSARFNSGSSDYLNRTFTTPTNRKVFTFSVWVKRSILSVDNGYLISAGTNASTNVDEFYLRSGDTLDFSAYESSVTQFQLRTTQLFRDVSAWYHLMVAYDSTQATSSNRIKMYVNGSQVTAFAIATYPSLNFEPLFNSATAHTIARNLTSGSRYQDGYLSEFYFIDGQALTPSSFGASNASGVWYPIPYSGSYGTNGFNLKFTNASSLGTDSSPNGNNFTVNNLTSVDQSTDSPLNNFATMNPLNSTNSCLLTQGNLKQAQSSNDQVSNGTMGFNKGKWYWEFKMVDGLGEGGIVLNTNKTYYSNRATASLTTNDTCIGRIFNATGSTNNMRIMGSLGNSTVGASVSYSAGDIVSVAVDADAGKIWFAKNGTYEGSGNPATGSSPTYDWSSNLSSVDFITVIYGIFSGTSPSAEFNFGSPPYAANSYADGNGYGNFSYAVPSGYYALCTANLNTYG